MASRPSSTASLCSAPDAAATVEARFPGRERHVRELAVVLQPGQPGDRRRRDDVWLVCGPSATGKTAVVRALLQAMGVRHAYFNCAESNRPRPLLSSLLHQLKGGKRMREDGYALPVKCDSVSDFRLQLPAAIGRGGHAWLVLDKADRLAGSELLVGLMRAAEDTRTQVSLLLLGGVGWASGRYLRDTAGVLWPREVVFKPYTSDQLIKIMERRHARKSKAAGSAAGEPAVYPQFLMSVVPPISRASNNLLDVQAACDKLFPLYVQPLLEGQIKQASQLFMRINSDVQQVINTLQLHQGGGGGGAALAGGAAGEGGVERGRASSAGLAFELPYVSKFLLLAAYIASRNKPASDRAVFDAGYRKHARRDAQASDRQVEAALAAKLRGPHTFPLERLLHIFYVIFADHDAPEEEEGEEEGGSGSGGASEAQREMRRVMQQAEVLHQVCSLVTLRLLDQCSGDVLEGQLYRCNLGEDMAQALAANVRLALTDYLRMG